MMITGELVNPSNALWHPVQRANVERTIQFTAASTLFKNEQDRQTALSIYRKARQTYANLQSRALAASK
jgi:hypothetical protein